MEGEAGLWQNWQGLGGLALLPEWLLVLLLRAWLPMLGLGLPLPARGLLTLILPELSAG